MGTPGPMVSQLSHDLFTDEMTLLAVQRVSIIQKEFKNDRSFMSRMRRVRGECQEREDAQGQEVHL